MATQARKY